jgi:hypothetical protein
LKQNRSNAIETTLQKHRPQVLLLGNGLIRSYSALTLSWKDLVYRIGTDSSIPYSVNIPLPMEIVLRTHGHVQNVLRDHRKALYGRIDSEQFRAKLLRLLDAGFDDILTTNYSYELEEAALGKATLTDEELAHLRRYIGFRKKKEKRYLLHTYHKLSDPENRIWHIHGEAANPDSIVIGHYYYGTLTSQCQSITKRREKDHWKYRECARNSWVDAFLTGDVYVLGFGFDYSETDLWWLMSKKARMKKKHTGKVYIYRPRLQEEFSVKYQLLQDYGASVISLGMYDSKSAPEEDAMFREFYPMAIDAIIGKMQENRGIHLHTD